MHIWFSFLLPSHLRENLHKSWSIYRKLKKNFHFFTKKKDGRSAIWLLFSASNSIDALNKIYSLLGFIDKLQPLYVQLDFSCFCKAMMTNITCFLSRFVMFLKYTPFSRAYYCFKFTLHRCVFSPDIFWQFCRESKTFSWPLILWSVFLPISFTLQKQFFSILNKTLLKSSYFGAPRCKNRSKKSWHWVTHLPQMSHT